MSILARHKNTLMLINYLVQLASTIIVTPNVACYWSSYKTFFLYSFPIWYAMRIASALGVKSTCIQIRQYIEITTFLFHGNPVHVAGL